MGDWHLAQINVGRMVAPKGDARVAGFFDALDRINAVADTSDGFIWRMVDEDGADATGIHTTPDPLLLINISVWRDMKALKGFVYKSDHAAFLRQRHHWFEAFDAPFLALWWVPAGHIPNVDEGLARLWRLQHGGAGPDAFAFAHPFDPPGMPAREKSPA